ncbi:fibrous sheath CABYR-binding protein-like [Dreissena polymorpha]|uniref:fibrous sheath CABYR-binding protein-like n=1 Tax=Dreissena polymorpha TaxID=45954 RepID=UPI0022643F0B|nr:fibrous sheath CABYR-binding protein-like [Dreissena polymorpha]
MNDIPWVLLTSSINAPITRTTHIRSFLRRGVLTFPYPAGPNENTAPKEVMPPQNVQPHAESTAPKEVTPPQNVQSHAENTAPKELTPPQNLLPHAENTAPKEVTPPQNVQPHAENTAPKEVTPPQNVKPHAENTGTQRQAEGNENTAPRYVTPSQNVQPSAVHIRSRASIPQEHSTYQWPADANENTEVPTSQNVQPPADPNGSVSNSST